MPDLLQSERGKMRNQKRIAVLGSGVAGAAITHRLAVEGHPVIALYRKADEGSSFTNQKWQHSGLLYPSGKLARKAWQAYQNMDPLLARFRYRPEVKARFLALSPDTLDERRRWWNNDWDVGSWGITWRELAASEYDDIGDVGCTNAVGGFETPDCVIDFPNLIAYLRQEAQKHGAEVIGGATVRKLEIDKHHNQIIGLRYETSDGAHEIECGHCIVAMGAWSLDLLENSGVKTPPIIRKKCVVLKYEGELVPSITVCLDIHKQDGNIADVTLVPFKEETLAAGTDWFPYDRDIEDSDVEHLIEQLVQCFPKLLDFQPTSYVCTKTEKHTAGGRPSLGITIYDKTDLGVGGLTLTLPGKASFMFELAAAAPRFQLS